MDILIGFGIYFIPTIIAFIYVKPNKFSIFAVNFLIGWTIIGWIISLHMAIKKYEPKENKLIAELQEQDILFEIAPLASKKNPKIKRSYAPHPEFSSFVVVDLETTGLSPSNDKIIEIGAIKIKENKIIDQFSTLINPLIDIPPAITKINGITTPMVKNSPTIYEVINDFWEFTEGLPLVAHNAPFDARFLEAASPADISLLYVDTLKFARQYFSELPNHKLDTLCNHLGIINESRHRAMGDCMVTLELYNSCKAAYEEENRVTSAKQYEKDGNIEKAIQIYEILIEEDFEGNLPYDRLAILYRKDKQYDEEIRVLLKAIDVFENQVTPERGDREPKLNNFKIRLDKAKVLRDKNISIGESC